MTENWPRFFDTLPEIVDWENMNTQTSTDDFNDILKGNIQLYNSKMTNLNHTKNYTTFFNNLISTLILIL